MHTEGQIRKAIKVLLDKYGELNISSIKSKLEEVLTFDAEDLEQSKSRNETLIMQRIGNIVSHQVNDVEKYEEGFIVDKKEKPAVFTATTGVKANAIKISHNDITTRKKRIHSFTNKKVNWDKMNKEARSVGLEGEIFVLNFERQRLKKIDPELEKRVIHLSQVQGDGCGYDISSCNDDGSLRRIEVKTTTTGKNDFFLTENERNFMLEYQDESVYIYRVYNFDKSNKTGDLEIISVKDFIRNYNLTPTNFICKKN